MRTPQTIAADAAQRISDAEHSGVGLNLHAQAVLNAEFMAASVAVFEAAGVLPAEAAPSSTDPV